ncbi:hypothetical protein M9458_058085, partial [Cirrhinus mrigala]
ELRCSQGRSTQRNFIVIFSELRAALRAGVLNLIHFVVVFSELRCSQDRSTQ